jgi:hypothetical protein
MFAFHVAWVNVVEICQDANGRNRIGTLPPGSTRHT